MSGATHLTGVERLSIRENRLPSGREKGGISLEFTKGGTNMSISIAANRRKADKTGGRHSGGRKLSMFRPGLLASAILAGLGLASPVLAQSTVYIPAILELSGAGAVSGTNFRDGMLLAIDEINAKGGLLGRKIETPV